MEAGFPRVCANTRDNKKTILFEQIKKMYLQGVQVTTIAKRVGVNAVTAFKWLEEAGIHKPRKLKHKEKIGRFAHLK
jgi:transposase-like protein